MIQMTSFTRVRNGWTLLWAPTGAVLYRIVLWGVEIARVTTNTYTWNGQGYTAYPPPLEVVSGETPALSEEFQPYLIMQWYGNPEDVQYQVQQYNGSIWQTLANVQEKGQWLYTFQTTTLTDETPYNYRVVALNNVGDVSVPRQFRRYVVCPPVPPDGLVDIGYTGGNITVTAV